MFYDIIYTIIKDYNELGAVLAVLILAVIVLALFVTQMIFQALLYGRIASFRLMNKRQIREAEPAISVVIPLFHEDWDYLDKSLVTVLTQNHKEFEVVLVYVGNDTNFFDDIKSLQRLYSHLTPVHINCSPHYPVSSKIALNIGIKSAKYDFIITSTPDATPASNRWLSLLARGFMYGDIVLGYSGMERHSGFKNFIFREYQFTNAMAWISSAIRQRTYAASRNALGFTKELYFSVRGFNHLDMNVGEDDLFLQQIATRDNVSVVLSPRATCRERSWEDWRWWWHRIKSLYSTRQYYPKMTTAASTAELITRFFFFISVIAALVVMPWDFKIVALVLLVVRFLYVQFIVIRNMRRVGESGLIGRHFIYDLIEPVLRLFVAMGSPRKDKQAW